MMDDMPLNDQPARLVDGLPALWYGNPDGPVDQVTRKLAYEDRHPDVRFIPPCVHDGLWTAVLPGGAVEVRACDLGLILDELEARDRLSGP